jgi:hypothetical protein
MPFSTVRAVTEERNALLHALALCCAVQFHAEADIAAPASEIWELLVDLEGYAAWNPWVVRYGESLRAGIAAETAALASEAEAP